MKRRGRRTDSPARPSSEFDDAFVRRLTELTLKVRRVAGGTGHRVGQRRTPAADFIDHRPYTPGDDLRHVDWRAAARHDLITVKVGRARDAADVRVLADVSPSVAVPEAKWRASVELTAAIGWIALARGDRLGIVPFPQGEGAGPWKAGSGPKVAAHMLRHVAGWAPVPVPSGDHAMEGAAYRALRDAPAGGLLIVISDFWRTEDLGRALRLAPAARWDVVLVHLLAAEEREPTVDGAVTLVDAETGHRLPLEADRDARRAVQDAVMRRTRRLAALCGRHGARYIRIDAEWPLERRVLPVLARAGIVREWRT